MITHRSRATSRDDPSRRRRRGLGLALAVVVVTGTACGSSGSHPSSAAPPTSAPAKSGAPTSTIPPAETVAGMHYEPLRTTVTPIVTAIAADLANGKPIGIRAAQLATAESVLQQFDTAAISFQATGTLKSTLDSLVSANQALLVDLRTLHSGSPVAATIRPGVQAHLAAWNAASAAANRALST